MALTRLDDSLITLVNYKDYGLFPNEKKGGPKYIIGETYTLQGTECEGFEMTKKDYVLKGLVNTLHGVELNSVIVKQVGGERGPIFTLSKHDCDELGIEFEDGLQLFPKGMPWKIKERDILFDEHDLSTNPTSKKDNMIRHVLLKLRGFTDYKYGYVLTPSGKLVKERELSESFVVKNASALIYPFQGMHIDEGAKLGTTVVMPKCVDYSKYGNYIADDDSIYLYVNLSTTGKGIKTIDGRVGVLPKSLEGLTVNDVLSVYYDDEKGLTEEEFFASLEKKKEEPKKECPASKLSDSELVDYLMEKILSGFDDAADDLMSGFIFHDNVFKSNRSHLQFLSQ